MYELCIKLELIKELHPYVPVTFTATISPSIEGNLQQYGAVIRKQTAVTQKWDDYTALLTWNYLILAQGAQLKLEPAHRTQKLAHSRTAACNRQRCLPCCTQFCQCHFNAELHTVEQMISISAQQQMWLAVQQKWILCSKNTLCIYARIFRLHLVKERTRQVNEWWVEMVLEGRTCDLITILLFQPTHNLYTLKTLKSHIKTLNICPYMFRSLMKPSSGGSQTALRQVTKLGSVDLHLL